MRNPMVGAPGRKTGARRKRSKLRVLARLGGFVFAALLVSLIAGFFWFTAQIEQYANTQSSDPADGIVVLTGGEARIETALELLRQSRGTRMLISGVHPDTTRSAILNATHIEHADLFECCIDIDRAALDTVGNAEQTRIWADKNDIRRLILVTSDYHLPRSLMEFHRKLGGIEIIPRSVQSAIGGQSAQLADPGVFRVVVPEYVKYVVALLRFGVRESETRASMFKQSTQ